jgi:Domain of unknown function DUF302
MDRLEAEIKANGMTVFARIDHAAGAAEAGLPLRPTELLIFGSAKAGTPLMQAKQAVGIGLPRGRRSDGRCDGRRAQRRCDKSNEITLTPRDTSR